MADQMRTDAAFLFPSSSCAEYGNQSLCCVSLSCSWAVVVKWGSVCVVSVPSTGREQELTSHTLQLAGTTSKWNIPAICWNIELGRFQYMKEVCTFFSLLSSKSLLGTCSFKSCHLSAALENAEFSFRSFCVFIVSLCHHCVQTWLSRIFFTSQEYF